MPKKFTEAQMRADWDADTMMRYEEIRSDLRRFNAAKKAAARKADEYEKSSKNARAAATSKRK